MTKIRTVIVDDEPLAREGVRVLLEKEDAFEIVEECSNGSSATAESCSSCSRSS